MKRRASPLDTDIHRCTFMCAQRASHRLMQIYDRALEPVGLTNAQYSFLAYLYRLKGRGIECSPESALAERVGLQRRALHRELQPLKTSGLVAEAAGDRRVRAVLITDKGCAKLRKARSFWRRAQSQVKQALGVEATLALNGLLDLTLAKLET
jgi:DNA-binding MarR family transcriptional regulator